MTQTNPKALQRIQEVKEKKLKKLDLSLCSLTAIPEKVYELDWIEELVLSHPEDYKYTDGSVNKITSIPIKVNSLKNLKLIHASELFNLKIDKNVNCFFSLRWSTFHSQNNNLPKNQIFGFTLINKSQIEAFIEKIDQFPNLTFLKLSRTTIEEISFIENLPLISSLYLSMCQLDDYSPIKKLVNLKTLYLSSNKLSDISFLNELKKLNTLDLSHNKIINCTALKELTQLQYLDLRNNQINDITFLKKLENLDSLDLGYNNIENYKLIGNLHSLSKLYLRRNQINEISFLRNLKNLAYLNLSNNQISNISSLSYLNKLTYVDLSYNKINDASPLENLKNLSSLSLNTNELTELSSIVKLKNLVSLDLGSNQINDFFLFEKLQKLVSLALGYSEISDISFLEKLPNLTSLYLRSNFIVDISPLGKLDKLDYLNLRYNNIKDVSTLVRLKNLNYIELRNNPINSPPPEIIDQGLKAIRNYFIELKNQNIDHLYEAKMLIIGSGGVGKTSLCNKIINPNWELIPESEVKEGEKSTTEGIDILEHEFEIKGDQKFKVNMWDFGGQEIYHATHQFFLTKRSLYVLVADNRKEDADLPYWLNVQQLLAGDSPMFIVQNEKEDRVMPLKENEIRKAFGNVKGFLSTNLKTNRGLEAVVTNLETELQRLPFIGDELPKSWVRIRKALEELSDNYISLKEYFKICAEHDMPERDRAMWLSEYLHDLGVILHFKDDPVLERIVILKNEWGTDAVYKVLDHPILKNKENRGRFSFEDLKEIWNAEEYIDNHLELITLMKKFKLCYELPVGQQYIAPQRLPVDQPDNYEWEGKINLQLKYKYEFMPKGILTRLIVEMHDYIKEEIVWNTGMLIHKEGATAEVKESYGKNEITIKVKGANPENIRRDIMTEIDKINKSFQKLEVEKLVPCNCIECRFRDSPHFFLESKLLERQNFGKYKIECGNPPYEEADVIKMLTSIKPSRLMANELQDDLWEDDYRRRHKHPIVKREFPNVKPNNDTRLVDSDSDNSSDKIVKEQFLFIGDVAKDEKRLWHPEEINTIKQNLLDDDSKINWAKEEGVTFKKFQSILVRGKYQYLYFAGHSSKNGIHLLDKNGYKKVVKHMDVFKHAKKTLKCAIFCSCDSDEFAPEVGKYVEYVIAMKAKIRDGFAKDFAEGFSLGLSAGRSIIDSFEIGLVSIQNLHEDKIEIPVLYINGEPYAPNN